MMKPKRFFVLLAVFALVAAACGGDSSTDDTDAPADTVTTTTADAGDVMVFEGLSQSADCSYGGELKSITAIDEFTVEFELCAPDVAFASKVAFSAFGIHSSEVLEATGGGGPELFDNPIGTGPYQLKAWEKGNQIVFERFDDYWGNAAKAETLVFRWSAEVAQRLVELKAGTVDGIDNIGKDDFDIVDSDPDLILQRRGATNVFYIGLNRDMDAFADERVRQAIAMGIDRQRIIDNFYPAGSTVASQFLPPDIFGFTENPSWYDFDPQGARDLLAEAGVENLEVTLNFRDVVRSYLPGPSTVAQDIQAQLADIGIKVNIEVMESGSFLDASDAGELTLYLLGWGADYPDATNFLDFHFGGGASAQFGEGFTDIHDVLAEAASTADPAKRLELYEEVTGLLKEHVPMVPVAHGGSGLAFRGDVVDSHSSPLGNEYFAVMDPGGRDTFVWMQNAEPIGLYCADETDGESLRACEQVNESLLAYEIGGAGVVPSLAETWDVNADGTVWTFNLRKDVKFHDGSDFDANDVVMSYLVQWDAANPLHVGRDGNFTYFSGLFGAFLNAES